MSELTCGHTKLFVDDFRGPQVVEPCMWCRLDEHKRYILILESRLDRETLKECTKARNSPDSLLADRFPLALLDRSAQKSDET
jgi:hypothetical protein